MFCIKIKNRLKKLLGKFDNYMDNHIDTALKVTSGLKRMLSSPVADIITAIVPGDADNVIRQQLISAISKAVDALAIIDNCKQYGDVNEKLSCFITQLHQLDPKLRDAILQKLASLLSGQLDGQRLKQSLYDLYTQAKYVASKA